MLSDWLEVKASLRVSLRYVKMEHGKLCVTKAGVTKKQELYVDSLDFLKTQLQEVVNN